MIATTKPSLVRSCSAWVCGMVTTLGTGVGAPLGDGETVGVGEPLLTTNDTVAPLATSTLADGLWLTTCPTGTELLVVESIVPTRRPAFWMAAGAWLWSSPERSGTLTCGWPRLTRSS